MADKIPAVRIDIRRAEGPTSRCRPVMFQGTAVWGQARKWLWHEPGYPKDGGYDKHDFRVTFADGRIYEGRLDCKHYSCPDNNLDVSTHIRSTLESLSGRRCPTTDPALWKQYLDMYEKHNPGSMEQAAKFLDTYSLCDE